MKIELAPMEGITSYIYRNALNRHYGGVDTYFTPFISTHRDKTLNFKEKKEINLQKAILKLKNKYGKNSILKGTDFEEGATTKGKPD